MTELSSKPDFEDCIGEWWRPDNPDDRLPGTLRRDRSNGRWVLTLVREGPPKPDTRHGVVDGGDTFFGRTSAGDATVLGASLASQHQRSSAGTANEGKRTAEVWTAFSAILNGHFEEESKWQSIGARIPHAWHWYSPTVLERGERPDLEAHHNEELTCTYRDIEIVLWRGTGFSISDTEHKYTGEAGYRFTRPSGITLADVEQPVLAINNLHRLLFGSAVSTDVLELAVTRVDSFRTVTQVRAAPARVPQIGLADPFVSTGDIDFADFLPRWISLHVEALTWPTLGPPGDNGGWLQTNTLDAVAALESLAREHFPKPAARRLFHDKILAAAVKGGITSDPKRYLRNLLERAELSLPERLSIVAESLGTQSAKWLLGPSVNDWAVTVTQVRNSLAHGVKAAGSLELGPEVLIAVMETTRTIFRLTLLRLAGWSDPGTSGSGSGETLVNKAGELDVRHKNSALVHRMRNAQEFRQKWHLWAAEIHAPQEPTI